MIRVRVSKRPLTVLDFDLENRPLSYMGGGFTSAEITAMAWSWAGDKYIESLVMVSSDVYMTEHGELVKADAALKALANVIVSADIVTGHYIRKHDLPLLSGALLEHGLGQLPRIRVQDTHGDLQRRKDLSASQESLAAMYGLPEAKHHMSQAEWREANRLTPAGVTYTRKRVVDDVIQHKALRKRLLEAGALKAPRWWNP